jgi:hypothetical protein
MIGCTFYQHPAWMSYSRSVNVRMAKKYCHATSSVCCYSEFMKTLVIVLSFLMVAFTLLLTSADSNATSFYIRPFSEFTQDAPNILRGTLRNIHVENSTTADGSRAIYTYANLEVKDRIKGDITAQNIVVRKTGGTKDGITLEIPSSPEFVEGEDTVLFLSEQRDDKSYETTGLELGKFGITQKDGQDILTGGIFAYSRPSANEAHEADHSVQGGDLSENRHPWSIQDLKELVKKEAAEKPNGTAAVAQVSGSIQNSPTTTSSIAPSKNDQVTQVQTKDFSDTSHENSAIAYVYGAIGLLIAMGIYWYLKRG